MTKNYSPKAFITRYSTLDGDYEVYAEHKNPTRLHVYEALADGKELAVFDYYGVLTWYDEIRQEAAHAVEMETNNYATD